MLILALMIIVTVGLSYSCDVGPSPKTSPKRIGESDAGSTIELQVGDRLEVTLPGNPTTGFQWEVGTRNAAILQSSGEPEFQISSNAPGSGGTVSLRFQAVGTGQMQLNLICHRPFEEDVPPVRIFEITVIVK